MKTNSSVSTLVLALLLLSLGAEASPAVAASSGSCTNQTDPFTVNSVSWGLPGSPVSAYPGDLDVPLTITFLFSGPCTSPQTTFYLGLTQGGNQIPFVGLNGAQEPSVVALNISPNTLVSETFYLNIDQNAQTGLTYYVPLIIQYSNNAASDTITQTAIASGGPLAAPVPLYGPVQLALTAGTTHLAPGAVNNVTITVANTGTGASGPVSIAASAPAGVTLFNQLATTGSLAPGASSSQVLQVFVSSSLSGSAFVLTFTSKYLDAYSNAQTATQTVGFTASGTAESSSFLVDGASWGSGASTTSPLPGSQDAPLVVTMQYLGSSPVTSLQGTLQLPSGFTDLNGRSSATAYSATTTNQYGAIALTFNLDIDSSVQPGTYNFTLSLSWMTSQSSGLTETVVLTPPPVAQLQSSFVVEGATWQRASNASAAASSTAPQPGSQDAPLVVSLQYLGTTSVTSLRGSLDLPSGFTDLNGMSTATAYAPAASSGQVVTLTFDLDVGSAVKPGSYNFTLNLSWLTSVGVSVSQDTTVMPPPVAAATAAIFPLSVAQLNSTVTAGSKTAAGFTLTNEGSATLYSPTFSLSVASPLVLTSVDSAVPTSALAPRSNTTFVAHVTAGPSASPGIYSGTLTVAFTDSSGASHSQSFPVSFTLDGTVVLILQDTAVSQTATGFTVTGSILNEGSVAVYYASITGLLGPGSATPVYLGEIDPNTPLPFSVTIPFTAPATLTTSTTTAVVGNGSGRVLLNQSSTSASRSASRSFNFTRIPGGNFSLPPGGFPGAFNRSSSGSSGNTVDIALSLSYKDTFGSTKLQAFTVPTTVKSASQLAGSGPTTFSTSPSGGAGLRVVAYGVVVVLAVALVGGALMLRRHRARAFARLPPEGRGDESVF